MATRKLTDHERSAVANALSAAAVRWREFAESLARPDVAQSFADQAAEADALSSLFGGACSVTLRGLPRD